MKRILILGSTGSIGTQTLDIIRANSDKFKVEGLAVSTNTDLLDKQIMEFKPKFVSVENTNYSNDNTIVLESALELVKESNPDIIVLAMVGVSGLKVAYQSVLKGRRIALANKETLVAGGDIIMSKAKELDTEILPVDSEHSAIWQCLSSSNNELKKILLTASGGAFRDYEYKDLIGVKAKDALNHPVWNMGKKVTIDSATLMNKGLEIIEAMHLFGVSSDKIEVVVHPESIIHSMVEYKDNTVIAQMSNPDMRLPIQLALTYPDRCESQVKSIDFDKLSRLTFKAPRRDLFPCLDIACKCAKSGGADPTIMNAANEIAVEKFLNNEIAFYDIPNIINKALDKYSGIEYNNIDDIIRIDRIIKEYILSLTL